MTKTSTGQKDARVLKLAIVAFILAFQQVKSVAGAHCSP